VDPAAAAAAFFDRRLAQSGEIGAVVVRKAAARSSLSEGGLAELEPKRGLALDWQKIDSQPASQTGQARPGDGPARGRRGRDVKHGRSRQSSEERHFYHELEFQSQHLSQHQRLHHSLVFSSDKLRHLLSAR
jgi:hypothetical protein